jgi:hypothetical protein
MLLNLNDVEIMYGAPCVNRFDTTRVTQIGEPRYHKSNLFRNIFMGTFFWLVLYGRHSLERPKIRKSPGRLLLFGVREPGVYHQDTGLGSLGRDLYPVPLAGWQQPAPGSMRVCLRFGNGYRPQEKS